MIKTRFDEETKTLYISGEGNIYWRDTIPYHEDTEHVVIEGNDIFSKNASNLFTRFSKLVDIKGHIDTSMCDDFSYMYAECFSLKEPIKGLDTRNGEQFDFFHSDNNVIERVEFNSTRKGFKFRDMFHGCFELKEIVGVVVNKESDINEVSKIDEIRKMLISLQEKEI